jgi:CDGSH-type Zn-finger protein
MNTKDQVSINVSKDGPYIVKNVSILTNSKGKSLETQPVMALCRCGSSKNKPFCDGSHIESGFRDEKN